MNSPKIKLIAADVDGTLLDDQRNYHPEFEALLAELERRGILFVIASGRNYLSLRKTFPFAHDTTVYICENGAQVRYQDENLLLCPLDIHEAKSIIAEAERLGTVGIVYSLQDKAYIKNCSPEVLDEVLYYTPVHEMVTSFDHIEEAPLGISLFDADGAQDHCLKILEKINCENSKLVLSGIHWLDIMNKNIDKGKALKFVQKQFNISYEESAAFGDNYNDVEMLESVSHSYAMQNAVEELRAKARFITQCDNDAFGAALEMRRILASLED